MKNAKSLPTKSSDFTDEQVKFLGSQGMTFLTHNKCFNKVIQGISITVTPKLIIVSHHYEELVLKTFKVNNSPMVRGGGFEDIWNEMIEYLESIL